MSAANASSSSSALVSFAQDIEYTKTEGFKQYKAIFNQKNAHAACNNPHGAYPMAEDVYHAVKSSGCSQKTFNTLSLQDFITSGSIAARHHLRYLSLVPYYAAQMKHCMQKRDKHDNQGLGTEVVDTCCQQIGVVGMGLYHSMADVQLTVRSNCGSDEQPDNAPKPEDSLEVGVKVGFLDVL